MAPFLHLARLSPRPMHTPTFATPEDAETAFYTALAHADLDAMMAVWSEDDEVVCIHPGGNRLVGIAAIREAWQQMFASGTRISVALHQGLQWNCGLTTIRNVRQLVQVSGDDRLEPPLLATNVFIKGARGWRLVMHHASPAPDTNNLHGHDTPTILH
jgi:ketosteroid isomerase-like protein